MPVLNPSVIYFPMKCEWYPSCCWSCCIDTKSSYDAGDARKLLFSIIYIYKWIVFLCFRS